MKKFELPNNDDVEKILMKNLKHTNPLEMKEKEVSGEKTLFPFWTPVKHDGAETFHDYQEYLTKKDKKLRGDKVGIVEPKSTFKTNANGSIEVKNSYEDYSIIGQMQSVVDKINDTDLGDNTGVVKATTEAMPKKKTDAITTNVTTAEYEEESNAAKPKGDKVGIVKPKGEGMPTKKVAPITKSEVIEQEVEEESNAAKPKGDNVGVVKPQADFDVDISEIDFKRFMK
jgi:hypothetical protein